MTSSNDCFSLCGCTAGKTAKQSRYSNLKFFRVSLFAPAIDSSCCEFSRAPYLPITIAKAATHFQGANNSHFHRMRQMPPGIGGQISYDFQFLARCFCGLGYRKRTVVPTKFNRRQRHAGRFSLSDFNPGSFKKE
jgi:hypothetical protein